jgi:hypothetical protein
VTAENPADPSVPDTIVLIHGLWVTSRSWEKWAERCEARGHRVLTPAYPGLEVEVEALLREDPSPIEALTPRDCQRADCVQKAQAVCRRAARSSPYTRGYAQRRRSQTDTAGVYGEHLSRGGEERWLKRRDVRQESARHVSGEA